MTWLHALSLTAVTAPTACCQAWWMSLRLTTNTSSPNVPLVLTIICRWRNFLSPDIEHPRKSPFSEWEVAVVVQVRTAAESAFGGRGGLAAGRQIGVWEQMVEFRELHSC